MAVPKGCEFRMNADYRVMNQLIEQASMAMSLGGAVAFSTLDMIQMYYQMPLHESAQERFAAVATGGLYTSAWVPQGVFNATEYR